MSRRHTVLVVDDEPDVVSSVKDLLRLEYKVLGATRASEGLKQLEENDVHVVMTDQRMPEMSGVELLQHVRDKRPDAVRLLFTGYADIKAVIDAINQGSVYRYITKPWEPDELLTVIREACERHDLVMDRKRLVGELRTKNEELEKANHELKRGDELKSAFIRVASHELRTPLTILSGLVDLAGRMPGSSAPMEGVIKRIRGASERMNQLVNQVVDMLGAQQFDNTLRLAMTDVGSLVSRAADDVRPFVDIRGQTLVVEAPAQELAAQMDAGKIRNAINHLLLNAVKFTPDGGTITVGAGRDEGGGSRFWVSDTGIGIEPGALARIFDKFFTEFDVSTHSSGHFEYGKKGLGLGLSLVKAFVEMHGGRVEAQSEVLRGTTITIRLPKQVEP